MKLLFLFPAICLGIVEWLFYLPHCLYDFQKKDNHTHAKVYLDDSIIEPRNEPRNCKLYLNFIFCGWQEVVYKYDIYTNTWEYTTEVKGSAMTEYNNKLYIIGRSGLFECDQTQCQALIRYNYNMFEAPYFGHVARNGSMWYLTRRQFFWVFSENIVLNLNTLTIREEINIPRKEDDQCIVKWVDYAQTCF